MRHWKNRLTSGAVLTTVLFSGCADLRQKAMHSDGFMGFVTALSGHEQIESYSLERISRGDGIIASVHMRKAAKGVFVFGDVEKGFDSRSVSAAWSHVDVVVLDSNGGVRCRLFTSFSPAIVPNTLRGVTGRSQYIVRLPFVPPEGSRIQVIFQPTAIGSGK